MTKRGKKSKRGNRNNWRNGGRQQVAPEEIVKDLGSLVEVLERARRQKHLGGEAREIMSRADLVVKVCSLAVKWLAELGGDRLVGLVVWAISQLSDEELWNIIVESFEYDDFRYLFSLLSPKDVARVAWLIPQIEGEGVRTATAVVCAIMESSTAFRLIVSGELCDDEEEREWFWKTAFSLVGMALGAGLKPIPRLSADEGDLVGLYDLQGDAFNCPVGTEEQFAGLVELINQTIALNDFSPEIKGRLQEVVNRREKVLGRIADLMGEISEAVESRTLKGWIPGEGMLKFSPMIAGCPCEKISQLVVTPLEDMPTLEFSLRYRHFALCYDDVWAVLDSGEIIFGPKPVEELHDALRVLLTLMCVRNIHQGVVVGCDGTPSSRKSSGRSAESSGSGSAAWLKTRRLPPGCKPSEAALERAERWRVIVPLGMTAYGTPSIRAEQGKEDPPDFRPVVVSDEGL